MGEVSSSLGCALGRVRACEGGFWSSRIATKTLKPGSPDGWGGGLRGETSPGGVSGGGADNAAAYSPCWFGGECKS